MSRLATLVVVICLLGLNQAEAQEVRELKAGKDFSDRSLSYGFAVSPSRSLIAVSGKKKVASTRIDLRTGERVGGPENHEWFWVYDVDKGNRLDAASERAAYDLGKSNTLRNLFFLDENRLLFLTLMGDLGIYDISAKTVTKRGSVGPRVAATMSLYDKGERDRDAAFVTASADGSIKLWSEELRVVGGCTYTPSGLPLDVVSKGGWIGIADKGHMHLVRPSTNERLQLDPGVSDNWTGHCLTFLVVRGKDGKDVTYLAAGGYHMNSGKSKLHPGRVCLWDVSSYFPTDEAGAPGRQPDLFRKGSGQPLKPDRVLLGFPGSVADLATDSRGRLLCVGGDLFLRIWDFSIDDDPIQKVPIFERSGQGTQGAATLCVNRGAPCVLLGFPLHRVYLWPPEDSSRMTRK